MKKVVWVLLLALLFTGCTAKVDLMPHASPETSALALYVYDGEVVRRGFLFEQSEAARVIRDFRQARAVPADVDVTALKPPFYGLEMGTGGAVVGSVHGLWADGYFLTDDGNAYKLNYDFEALLEKENWESWDTFSDLQVMPCASFAAKTESGWNKSFLSEAEPMAAPEGISMELVNHTDDTIVARFVNNSGREWMYGLSYRVQVCLDGTWYNVPAEQEYAIVSLAVVLPDGKSQEEAYNLSFYGSLPAGTYRLAAENMAAVFEVK